MTVIRNLKFIRQSNGLTQEAFAELVKMDYRNYQRLESGNQGDLRFSTLERFSKALKVDWWELVHPDKKNITIESKRKPPKAPHYERNKTPRASKNTE